MDAAALIAALLGLTIAAHGYVLIGSAVLAGPLIAFAILLSRSSKRPLLLLFSFNSSFLIIPIALLIASVFQLPILVGLAAYYVGCVSLVERKAEYVPWGRGFTSKAVSRSQRPVVYWLVVGLHFTVSAVILGVALVYAPLK